MSAGPVLDKEAGGADKLATVTYESLFANPEDAPQAPALRNPVEPQDGASSDESLSRRSSMSSIRDSLDTIRSQAKKAIKKSHKAMRKSAAVLSYQQSSQKKAPEWVNAEKGLEYLRKDDADVLRQTLEGPYAFALTLVLHLTNSRSRSKLY